MFVGYSVIKFALFNLFCQTDPHTHDSERKRVASQVTGNESQKKKVKVIDISQQQNGESGKRIAKHEEETLLFRY